MRRDAAFGIVTALLAVVACSSGTAALQEEPVGPRVEYRDFQQHRPNLQCPVGGSFRFIEVRDRRTGQVYHMMESAPPGMAFDYTLCDRVYFSPYHYLIVGTEDGSE